MIVCRVYFLLLTFLFAVLSEFFSLSHYLNSGLILISTCYFPLRLSNVKLPWSSMTVVVITQAYKCLRILPEDYPYRIANIILKIDLSITIHAQAHASLVSFISWLLPCFSTQSGLGCGRVKTYTAEDRHESPAGSLGWRWPGVETLQSRGAYSGQEAWENVRLEET